MLKRFALSDQPEWWKRHQLWNGAWFPWELNSGEQIWSIARACGACGFRQSRSGALSGSATLSGRGRARQGRSSIRSFRSGSFSFSGSASGGAGRRCSHHSTRSIDAVESKSSESYSQPFLRSQQRKKKALAPLIAAWLRSDFSSLLDELPEALEAWIPLHCSDRSSQSIFKDRSIIVGDCGLQLCCRIF